MTKQIPAKTHIICSSIILRVNTTIETDGGTEITTQKQNTSNRIKDTTSKKKQKQSAMMQLLDCGMKD